MLVLLLFAVVSVAIVVVLGDIVVVAVDVI